VKSHNGSIHNLSVYLEITHEFKMHGHAIAKGPKVYIPWASLFVRESSSCFSLLWYKTHKSFNLKSQWIFVIFLDPPEQMYRNCYHI